MTRERVKKLMEEFDLLSEDEKMEFLKQAGPQICAMVAGKPDKMMSMMEHMMPYCREMMHKNGMHMKRMMQVIMQDKP